MPRSWVLSEQDPGEGPSSNFHEVTERQNLAARRQQQRRRIVRTGPCNSRGARTDLQAGPGESEGRPGDSLPSPRCPRHAAGGRAWQRRGARSSEGSHSLTRLRPPGPDARADREQQAGPRLRRPWRRLEGVTDNHPEVADCFRGGRARGGK